MAKPGPYERQDIYKRRCWSKGYRFPGPGYMVREVITRLSRNRFIESKEVVSLCLRLAKRYSGNWERTVDSVAPFWIVKSYLGYWRGEWIGNIEDAAKMYEEAHEEAKAEKRKFTILTGWEKSAAIWEQLLVVEENKRLVKQIKEKINGGDYRNHRAA